MAASIFLDRQILVVTGLFLKVRVFIGLPTDL
jgi:hypothetical protein